MPNSGIWNAYKPMDGRPLPGFHEKQADRTVAHLQAMFKAQGPPYQPGAPLPSPQDLNDMFMMMFDDFGVFAAGGPMEDFEMVAARPDIYPRGDGASPNEYGVIARAVVFRKDGGSFNHDAMQAIKDKFDGAANMDRDLSNAKTGQLGLSMLKVRRQWNEKDNAYESDAHILALYDANAPLMAPGARVRFNGEFDAAAPIPAEDIAHYLPNILTGCLGDRLMYAGVHNAHFSPAYFKLIRSSHHTFPEGVRTWFSMVLDVPAFQGADMAASFAAMFLEECFDKEARDVMRFITGMEVDARMFEAEPEAFTRPSRFMRQDNTGFLVALIGDPAQMDTLFGPEYEKMVHGIVEAGNSAIDYNIMNFNGDPRGPRLNATNFEIIGYGHGGLGPTGGAKGAIMVRVLGAENVDFPELTREVHNVMSSAVTQMFGMMAIVQPIMGGGDDGGDDMTMIDISLRLSGLDNGDLKSSWAEADQRVKALFGCYLHMTLLGFTNPSDPNAPRAQLNSLLDSSLGMGPDGSQEFYLTTFALVHQSQTMAAMQLIEDGMDSFEMMIRADSSVNTDLHMEVFSRHNPPPGIAGATSTFVTSFGVAGIQESVLDMDAFTIAVENSLTMSLMMAGGPFNVAATTPRGSRLIGCHWETAQGAAGTGPMQYARCQAEVNVTKEFGDAIGNIPNGPSLDDMVSAALLGASTHFNGAWGGQSSFFLCPTCGVQFRPRHGDNNNQHYAELHFRYENFPVKQFEPSDSSNAAKKSLYYAAAINALREIGVQGVTDGHLYISFDDDMDGGNGNTRRLSHMTSDIVVRVPVPDAQSEGPLEAAERDLAQKIADYIKNVGGFDPYADIPPPPPPPSCIPHVFKYDRMDGSGAQVATNNCMAMFPQGACANAPEIDDGRGNKYKLMGPWDSYNHLQSCNNNPGPQ